jgi:hypothetical protein
VLTFNIRGNALLACDVDRPRYKPMVSLTMNCLLRSQQCEFQEAFGIGSFEDVLFLTHKDQGVMTTSKKFLWLSALIEEDNDVK